MPAKYSGPAAVTSPQPRCCADAEFACDSSGRQECQIPMHTNLWAPHAYLSKCASLFSARSSQLPAPGVGSACVCAAYAL